MDNQSYFKSHHPMNMTISLFWKGYALAAFASVIAFIIPVRGFLIFSFALVCCDLFTGLRAARKRGEPIRSRGLFRMVEKLILYFIAILLAEGVRYVFMPSVPITYLVALAISLTEFKSNIENIETVTGVNIWAEIKDKINLAKK